jgi:hypothetical protein
MKLPLGVDLSNIVLLAVGIFCWIIPTFTFVSAQNCNDTEIDFYTACNGFPQGRITVSPKGVPPFEIIFPGAINNIDTIKNLYASNYTFNRLPPKNYPIIVKDSTNCVTNFTVQIVNSTSPTLTVNSIPNTNCTGEKVLCDYQGPSILINEVCISPGASDGSMYSGVNYVTPNYGEGEWIEIFNPDKCNSVDVSGYLFGTYNTNSNSFGMGFLIPDNTIIPPNGFLVLRGRSAPAPPINNY